jgi:hypothetical protein
MRLRKCRHCAKEFVPHPEKPGLIDECPVCVEERAAEAASTTESEETIELLKESIRTSRFTPKPEPRNKHAGDK